MDAGIKLVPFGFGMLLGGLVSGVVADRTGVRNLCVGGALVTMTGLVGLTYATPDTNYWIIAFALFISGVGSGTFNSPNGLAGMMSVPAKQRGVASAIRMLVLLLPQLIGLVVVFSLILNSMSQEDLIGLLVFGSVGLSSTTIDSCISALGTAYWICVAATLGGAAISAAIPGDWMPVQPGRSSVLSASLTGVATSLGPYALARQDSPPGVVVAGCDAPIKVIIAVSVDGSASATASARGVLDTEASDGQLPGTRVTTEVTESQQQQAGASAQR